MKNDFKIIAYATSKTPYVAELNALRESCLAVGYTPFCMVYPSAGSWQANTLRKARFISDMCARFPGRPLVYLDADARVHKHLTLFEHTDCDFAAHWFRDSELISSAMFFRNDLRTELLLVAWRLEIEQHPDRWDQKSLQAVVDRCELNVLRLPPEYCWIDAGNPEKRPDLSEAHYGQREPVIQQTQASRRYKKLVGRE